MKTKNNDLIAQNKVFGYIAGATALVLSLPLVGMQITSEVDWSLTDFIIMGVLLFGMGSLFILVARKVNKKHRLVVGVVVLAALLLIWAHLAVGLVDSWPLAGS